MPTISRFANSNDYAECEKLHREFGTTYYFATKWFPRETRNHVHAVYGFVRVPDEWVDNPGDLTPAQQREFLQDWRKQLLQGVEGIQPQSGVMRAFVDTLLERGIPIEEPLEFLDAMEMDLDVKSYRTYHDLQGYMRGSASAVGAMMLYVMEDHPTPAMVESAMALGEAMQMTNFLRDIGEDLLRQRLYIPTDDLEEHGVTDQDIERGQVTDSFVNLMKFEIARTRAIFASSDEAIKMLNPACQRSVLLARILYSRILDVIEANDYQVFSKRARTSPWEKLLTAALVVADPRRVLSQHARRGAL